MRAAAHLQIGRCGIRAMRAPAPFAFRQSGRTVWFVQTAGGPLGGDDLTLRIDVEPGATAIIRSAAAQLVQPGPHGDPCRIAITARVPDGAALDWAPEPTVLVAGCRLQARTSIELEGDARLRWRDELVLGRYGEPAGDARTRLRVLVDGRAAVHHEPDLSSFGVGDHHVVATTVERHWSGCGATTGDGAMGATLATPDPHTVLHLALGPTLGSVRR
jgi:urease accessory protein